MWGWLSTREWATVFWLVVLVVWGLTQSNIRPSLAGALRSLLAWKVLVAYLALVAWALGWVFLASRVGVWNVGLVKDTVAWLLVYGFVSLMDSGDASQEDGWFRRASQKAVGLGALMQFLLNLHTFHIVAELALQPVLALIVGVGIVAQRDANNRTVARLSGVLLAIFGGVLFIWSVVEVVHSWGGTDAKQAILALAFSLWLPLVVLPFTYGLALVATYETLFMHLRWSRGKSLPWRVRLAVVQTLGGRLRSAADLTRDSGSQHSISHAEGYMPAREAVRLYLLRRRAAASR